MKVLWQEFIAKRGNRKISYEHFRRLSKMATKTKTIRTGAADCNCDDIPGIFVARAIFGITADNVLAIDEKPFVLRKLTPSKVMVLKEHTGKVYKPVFKSLNMKPFYLIACIRATGLVLFALSNDPYNTLSFNAFMTKLTELVYPDESRFVLLDNASFHGLFEDTKLALGRQRLNITHTAPSTCFLDPIEEFFAIVQHRFIERLYKKIAQNGKLTPVSREGVKEMIVEAVHYGNRFNLRPLFIRAGLF
jgi:hypothetical protein